MRRSFNHPDSPLVPVAKRLQTVFSRIFANRVTARIEAARTGSELNVVAEDVCQACQKNSHEPQVRLHLQLAPPQLPVPPPSCLLALRSANVMPLLRCSCCSAKPATCPTTPSALTRRWPKSPRENGSARPARPGQPAAAAAREAGAASPMANTSNGARFVILWLCA